MSAVRRTRLVAGLAAITMLMLAACGGSGGSSAPVDTESSAPPAPAAPTSEGSTDSELTPPEDDPAQEESLPEEPRFLPVLGVEPTEPGPRPLLSWAAVDGAASYQLVILGSDGTPYWAWAGPETQVFVGGFDDPDAVGPWVHEAMSFTVSALDADGVPLALSNPATLTP